jgi:hypothetical protein
MKLGTLLLRDGIINLDQLEAALRAQVLFGGRLGTNLVELGHVSLDTLTDYLARTLAMPAATQAMFEAADPRILTLVPAALAEKHLVFPLGLEPGDPPRLRLAVAEPRDMAAVAAVEKACGVKVWPHVVPELRVLFYLEQAYGITRKPRFVRAAPAADAQPPTGERRRFLADAAAAPVSIQPRRNTNPPVMIAPAAAEPVPAPTPRPASLSDTLDRLEAAENRDAIAEAVLAFARGRLEACVLFLLKGSLALGWRGFAPGLEGAGVESVSLPLAAPSCLQSAYDTRVPWRGAPGVSGKSLDATLFMRLRQPAAPDEVLTIAVAIGQRVVNLVYAHAHAGGALDDGVVDGMISVSEAAADAYARLIQAAKQKG